MNIPTDYLQGYEKARAVNPEMASNYVAHTHIGDPLADAMVADLADLEHEEAGRLVETAMNDPGGGSLGDAPASLREFFSEVERRPDWLDYQDFGPSIRMFHRNSYTAFVAILAAVLIEGYTTNIAKSFALTGRTRDKGLRRLGQNSRHVVEVFVPGGMERDGDGWKLSVRIRIVHAWVRRMLWASDDWDEEAWGTPICAAHTGFALCAFSARLLHHMKRLGADCNDEELKSFMDMWRYAGYLIGIPETIMYKDHDDAVKLFDIGLMCEPPPSLESVIVAHSLLNQAPLLARTASDPASRRKEARYVYRLSGALIDKELAKALNYPNAHSFGVVQAFWLRERLGKLLDKLIPGYSTNRNLRKYEFLLQTSVYDQKGIRYELPDSVYSEESRDW